MSGHNRHMYNSAEPASVWPHDLLSPDIVLDQPPSRVMRSRRRRLCAILISSAFVLILKFL